MRRTAYKNDIRQRDSLWHRRVCLRVTASARVRAAVSGACGRDRHRQRPTGRPNVLRPRAHRALLTVRQSVTPRASRHTRLTGPGPWSLRSLRWRWSFVGSFRSVLARPLRFPASSVRETHVQYRSTSVDDPRFSLSTDDGLAESPPEARPGRCRSAAAGDPEKPTRSLAVGRLSGTRRPGLGSTKLLAPGFELRDE